MLERARFAPSPTGPLHIGGLRTALFNFLVAKKSGGSFILRIEDTDAKRTVKGAEKHIIDSLKWLGLDFDEGPVRQSSRGSLYKKSVSILIEKGLAYYAFDTPNDLEKAREQSGGNFKYNFTTRMEMSNSLTLTNDETESRIQRGGYSVRMVVPEKRTIKVVDQVRGGLSFSSEELEDKIIMKSDGMPTYHLANIVDDHFMEISHVIRGEDHISNTAKQLLLYEALGLSSPSFAHTPLILNPEGRKLSKRDGVTSIGDFQAMGYTAEALANYMTLLGWSVPEGTEERFTLKEAAEVFSFDRVNKAGAKFDWDKLNWLNAQVLHGWSPAELLSAVEPLWQKQGWVVNDPLWANDLAVLLGPSLTLIEDGVTQARPFFEEPPLEEDGLKQLDQAGARPALQALLSALELNAWDGLDIERAQTLLKDAAASAEVKKGVLMKSLRAALLGRLQGPDLITTWALLARLGNDRQRLRRCF